ncbi:ArdC-like ssDNA-binding domain-containing protein [Nocardia tengchongensis]|uniref:ArdC-like ssDNA-binding domain-containing protein n=1 Tax=Nocardia tengchongensis TaxID=2055889 RepID=UPI0036094871
MATRRRRSYTPEQRAARDAADDAIKAEGLALLADPDAVSTLVTRLATLTAPSMVCRYSLRNHALLDKQAAARGMTLSDVGSVKDWNARGRGIRKGETGFRIVAPKGREEVPGSDTPPADAEPITEPADNGDNGDGETATRTRYRMVSVFDIAQTVGIEDFDDEPVIVAPVADPVAALRASLVAQLERRGYQITTGDAPALDHDARTVTTSENPTIDELAQALAAITTLPADQRPTTYTDSPRPARAPRAAAPADPSRIPLELGKYADGSATIRTDTATGLTYYTVTGPRIAGTFTIAPQSALDSDRVHMVTIHYGEYDTRHHFDRYHRKDRPIVNGLDLIGGTGGLAIDQLDRIDGRRVHCRRPTDPQHDTDVPPRTKERTAAVMRAILAHYVTRDDLPALHRAAAAIEAADRQRDQTRYAAAAAAEITKLEAKRAEYAAAAARYADLATDTEQLTLAI